MSVYTTEGHQILFLASSFCILGSKFVFFFFVISEQCQE